MDQNNPLHDIRRAPTPTRQTSNFGDPDSHGRLAVVVCSTFMGLMIVFVTLRVYSRVWLARAFGKDDYACVVATIFLICYTAVVLDLAAGNGIGPHQGETRASFFTSAMLKRLLILRVSYPPAMLFTKLSLFLMYLRIFSPSRQTRYLVFFGITMIVLFYTACFLTEAINCTPRPRESWIEAQESKRCGEHLTLGYVMAAFNVLSDFYLLAIPIPVVWKLQLPLRRKVGASVIFMTGFLGCICSVFNTFYRIRAAQSPNVTGNLVPIDITSVVEICVGIMAGCMPHMALLFRNQFVKSLGSFSFEHLKARVVLSWSRRSKEGSAGRSSQFDRVDSKSGNDFYLETPIQGSVQGDGKFLDSGVYPQRQWIDRSSHDPLSQGVATVRERWDD